MVCSAASLRAISGGSARSNARNAAFVQPKPTTFWRLARPSSLDLILRGFINPWSTWPRDTNARQNAEGSPEYFAPTPHPERPKPRTPRLEVLAKFEFGIDCFQLPTI